MTNELRGRGIGASLLEAGEAWAREHGAGVLTLTGHVANTGALAFYERLGYRNVGFFMVKPLLAPPVGEGRPLLPPPVGEGQGGVNVLDSLLDGYVTRLKEKACGAPLRSPQVERALRSVPRHLLLERFWYVPYERMQREAPIE